MLLFSDGFETYNIYDIGSKWGFFGWMGETLPKIVSGIDPIGSKPYARKGGRALYAGHVPVCLNTTFKPSRTIHLGFAVRTRSVLKMAIDYSSLVQIDRGAATPVGHGGASFNPPPGSVSSIILTFNQYNLAFTQTFSGAAVQVGDIPVQFNLWSGDFHYIQAALTLMGNASAHPQAWIEVRVGARVNNHLRYSDILTSLPDDTAPYSYINGVCIRTGGGGWDNTLGSGVTLDDVYICNDEGAVNNTFLGNVKVRRVLPTGEGSENDGVPNGGVGYRFMPVDADFIDTGHNMPYPQPTPEQDPLFIPWEDGLSDYLTLPFQGARQFLRFGSVNFGGSSPHIHGAVLHALARGQYRNTVGSTALKGVKKTGAEPIKDANPTDAPLVYSAAALGLVAGWDTYPLVFENDEVVAPGQQPLIWNPDALNNSEFGLELARCTLDPKMYDRNLIRFNLVHNQVVSEFLGLYDFTHRWFDETLPESLALNDSAPTYQYTWKFTDGLYWSDELSVYRTFPRFINDTLSIVEDIPWAYLFAQGQIGFADEIFLQWHDAVEEELVAEDWASGFWEELFTDGFDIADISVGSFIEMLDELFSLEEPYLWDGHEEVEEILGITVTYVWDNHELMEEYLYPDDAVSQGIGLDIVDGFGLAENHHDGWWVDQPPEQFRLAVSVLNQHWRYERIFGLVVRSWQVEPTEQIGNDGDHTGDNPWGA